MRSRPTARRVGVVGSVLLATMLTACGTGTPTADPTEETSMTAGYGQGPMEKAVVRMMRMRTEMMDALDAELGPKPWRVAANDDGPIGAGCNDGVSQTLGLRMYTFPDTYPAGRWHDAAAIVERVGRRYGFDVVRRTTDEPGNLDVTGLAPDGGSYHFAMATATVLGVTVGCYRWDRTPGPDDWQSLDPKP